MNLRDLQYIVAIAETLNFSEAAKQCNVSQPTLSAQVKKLEEWLGVLIFERTNKSVLVTEVGKEIVGAAKKAVAEAERIREFAEASRDPFAGKFRLGAFPTLAPYYLPKIVPVLREIFPKLTLILVEEKTEVLKAMLKEGRLDAALLAMPIPEESLDTAMLFEDPFLLAVPANHPLAGSDGITTAEIASQPLLLLEEGHCLREQALEVCSSAGGRESQEFRATSLETLREMVKAGTGLTLMPQTAIRKGERGIRYLSFSDGSPHRDIAIAWRKTSARKGLLDKMAEVLLATQRAMESFGG